MRALLDTHAFLWWLEGDPSLSAAAREVIADEANEICVSAATAWEITKFRLGKLAGAAAVAADVQRCVASQGFVPLVITIGHAQFAGSLSGAHRDPFDRMLIAQSILEGCALISNEQVFEGFGVARWW